MSALTNAAWSRLRSEGWRIHKTFRGPDRAANKLRGNDLVARLEALGKQAKVIELEAEAGAAQVITMGKVDDA